MHLIKDREGVALALYATGSNLCEESDYFWDNVDSASQGFGAGLFWGGSGSGSW